MFILDYNKFWEHNKEFLNDNHKELDNLINFFIPGQLYINTTNTPAFLNKQKFINKQWDWLTQSHDLYNNIIPIMFIEIITGSNNQPTHIIHTYKTLSKTVCLHFLQGANSIYVPIEPGKESLIFQPLHINGLL